MRFSVLLTWLSLAAAYPNNAKEVHQVENPTPEVLSERASEDYCRVTNLNGYCLAVSTKRIGFTFASLAKQLVKDAKREVGNSGYLTGSWSKTYTLTGNRQISLNYYVYDNSRPMSLSTAYDAANSLLSAGLGSSGNTFTEYAFTIIKGAGDTIAGTVEFDLYNGKTQYKRDYLASRAGINSYSGSCDRGAEAQYELCSYEGPY